MKTAADVLKALDEHIAEAKERAAKTCIDFFVEEYDGNNFREAMNHGAKFRALQEFRNEIASRIDLPPSTNRRRAQATR